MTRGATRRTHEGRARIAPVLISLGLLAFAVATIWEGAGRGCAPGSDARLVAQVLGCATVGLGAGAALAASPIVRSSHWRAWWLAAVGLCVLLMFGRLLHFATACSA